MTNMAALPGGEHEHLVCTNLLKVQMKLDYRNAFFDRLGDMATASPPMAFLERLREDFVFSPRPRPSGSRALTATTIRMSIELKHLRYVDAAVSRGASAGRPTRLG